MWRLAQGGRLQNECDYVQFTSLDTLNAALKNVSSRKNVVTFDQASLPVTDVVHYQTQGHSNCVECMCKETARVVTRYVGEDELKTHCMHTWNELRVRLHPYGVPITRDFIDEIGLVCANNGKRKSSRCLVTARPSANPQT